MNHTCIVPSVNGVAATTFLIKVQLKIGTLYSQMSNRSALSMGSKMLHVQNNTLQLQSNLWKHIPVFVIYCFCPSPYSQILDHSKKSATIRESNHGSGVYKEHYA